LLRRDPPEFCSGPVHQHRAQPANFTICPEKFGHESPRKCPIAALSSFTPASQF
jgi:hypothetical protein